jgi:hypothetical protein
MAILINKTKLLASSLIAAMPMLVSAGPGPEIAKDSKLVPYDSSVFKSDPIYKDLPYDAATQIAIYGNKQAMETPRPLLELGYRLYDTGPIPQSSYVFGKKNPVTQQFLLYGDWRTAVGQNQVGDVDQGVLATKLNLEADWKLTATERVHLLTTPLDSGGKVTRATFGDIEETEAEFDASADAFFFEGDLGAIMSGVSDEYKSWDLPFAVGLMPLLFQNGYWVDDAFTGIAVTMPAMNSAYFDISNMDVTFFAAFDNVSAAVVDETGQLTDDDVQLFGVTTFLDASKGYWELGLGRIEAQGDLKDQSHNNAAVGFTRRYGGWLSNSVRVIHTFGQKGVNGIKLADGSLVLFENSLITSLPSTLVPYANMFFGSDRPQSLARATAAGGVLKHVGINFETDGLTGLPTLDASAQNTVGGAVGVSYLFGLNQQLVVEVAAVAPHGDAANRPISSKQFALGMRFQRNLSKSVLVRADAMMADLGNDQEAFGVRTEIRKKF